jgi:TolB-like protein
VVDEGATAQQTASSRLRRRTVLAATALLVLAAALGVGLSLGSWRDRLWELHPAQIRSIAVLPFENLTGDAAEDRLVEAVADSLTTELVRARLLEIASRTSAARLSDARGGVPEIAQRLNVDAVVEGSVSRLGQRWLVNVQLIQGSSDRHVWAERYERETGELSTLPGEVAWEMLRAIPPDLQPPNERGAAHRRPANEQAYDAYVLGRHLLWKRTAESVATAISVFEQSIAYDPAYGPAYSGLSDAYRNDATFTQ